MYNLKSDSKKLDTFENLPMTENPHFLSYPHETWGKQSSHEVIIFIKFHENRTKLVDFLIIANYRTNLVFLFRL